jgi:transcriptional regulator GlxA family with amidase domain
VFRGLLAVKDWEKLASEAHFNVALMAARCRVSVRTLERFFRLRFNQTPRQWASVLRCQRATLLLRSGYSNNAVAQELGFANKAHLCHEFKKICGVSPQIFVALQMKDTQIVAFRQLCRISTTTQQLRH